MVAFVKCCYSKKRKKEKKKTIKLPIPPTPTFLFSFFSLSFYFYFLFLPFFFKSHASVGSSSSFFFPSLQHNSFPFSSASSFFSFFLHLKHTNLKPCCRPSQASQPFPFLFSSPYLSLFTFFFFFFFFCFCFFVCRSSVFFF